MEDDKLVCLYTKLALRYASIPYGLNWVTEYEVEQKVLLEKMTEIKKILKERGVYN